jgi:hypothetical protein
MPRILLLLLLLTHSGFSQFKNQWIQYDQTYLKFSFTKTGVYRLYKKDITFLPGAETNPNNLQVIFKGRELLSSAQGLSDGRFDDGDYLEFFLQANMGDQDSTAYQTPESRPPVTVNLFSDETFVFITLGKTAGKRYTPEGFRHSGFENNIHFANEITQLQDTWSFNNLTGAVPSVQQSYYERGESWTGPLITNPARQNRTFTLTNYVEGHETPVQFTALLATRGNIVHDIAVRIGERLIGSIRNVGYDHHIVSTNLQKAEYNGSFNFNTSSLIPTEAYSWTQFKVRYPQKIDLNGRDTLTLYPFPSSLENENLRMQNANHLVYDITDVFAPRALPVADGSIFISSRKNVKRIFAFKNYLNFSSPQVLRFQKPSITANYILLTHPSLRSAAEEYKAYRTSAKGGSHTVEILEIHDIYNQFNYGDRSPAAIRDYLRYQMQSSKAGERFLLLIGKPYTFPNYLKEEAAQDLVPSFGYPGSDAMFSAGLGGLHQDVPAYLTGRIAARTSQEVLQYLQKVKEYESLPLESWKKNTLHLNGGATVAELNSFRNYMQKVGEQAEKSAVNASVKVLSKQTTEPTEFVNISKETNQGLGFISYFGHGSSSTLDFNFGYVSDNQLGFNNKGKYPFMYFNGCGVSNIFFRYNPLSTDWLFTPNKGAIAVLANSFWAYAPNSMAFLDIFYEQLFNKTETIGKPVALILQKSLVERTKANGYSNFDQSNSHQLILQGDPALVVNPFSAPDYTWEKESISLQSASAGKPMDASSEVVLHAKLENLGLIQATQEAPVRATVTYTSGEETFTSMHAVRTSFGTEYVKTVPRKTGITKVKIHVNPQGQTPELNADNNQDEISIDWDAAKSTSIYPYRPELDKTNPVLLGYMNEQMTSSGTFTEAPRIRIVLKDDNALETAPSTFRILLNAGEGFEEVKDFILLQIDQNTVEASFLSPAQKGEYQVLINGFDRAGNTAGNDLSLQWKIEERVEVNVQVAPHPVREQIKFRINSQGAEVLEIQLFDALGRTVHESQYTVQDGPNEVYVRFKPSLGTYLYKVILKEKTYTGKIKVSE